MKYPAAGGNAFPLTHWTLVIAAIGDRSSLERDAALERLCGVYWYPVYAFIRVEASRPNTPRI